MRLTAELIQNSLSYINPLLERELDLRGHKIPAIENLGVAKDQDAIDLTDNDVATLANFPFSPRLRSLLLARNRVVAIAPGIARSLPNLASLVLTQNLLAELADLDPLRELGRLSHLVLLENPVTGKQNYRYWIIWRCPSVRFLDFQRVRDTERIKAAELFGTHDKPTALAKKILSIKSRSTLLATQHSLTLDAATAGDDDDDNDDVADAAAMPDKQQRLRLTARERARVETLIRNAGSLAEIARLEKDLNEGRLPPSVISDSAAAAAAAAASAASDDDDDEDDDNDGKDGKDGKADKDGKEDGNQEGGEDGAGTATVDADGDLIMGGAAEEEAAPRAKGKGKAKAKPKPKPKAKAKVKGKGRAKGPAGDAMEE